jgi:hypothetical protein
MIEWQSIAGVLTEPPWPPSSKACGDLFVDTKMFIVDKKQNQLVDGLSRAVHSQ